MTPGGFYLPDCFDYFGGCDPSPAHEAVREAAALFGYGPEYGHIFLLLTVIAVVGPVLYYEPLPETYRSIALRIGAGLGTHFLLGWSRYLFVEKPSVLLVITILLAGGIGTVLFTISAARRALQVAQNLRENA